MGEADRKENTILSVLRSQKGFSLSELLVTLVLVGLISAAVAGGVSMVARSYTKVVDRADAEQLLSTVVSRITDELSYAIEPVEPANKATSSVEFISGLTGMRVYLENRSEEGKPDSIYMAYYYIAETPAGQEKKYQEIPLIDSKLKDRMSLSFGNITYNKNSGLFTIKNIAVTLKNKKDPIVIIDSYTVARINN